MVPKIPPRIPAFRSLHPTKSCVLLFLLLISLCCHGFSAALTPHSMKSLTSNQNGRVRSDRFFVLASGEGFGISDKNENSQVEAGFRGGETSSPPVWNKSIFREMLAEMIGTFLIVMIGTGSVMSAIYTDSLVGLFQIASVWIIAVTIAICTTASISGAHLNPAVSIAFAMVRPSSSFNWKKVVPYGVAQLLGAVLGSWINFAMYSSTISAYEKANNIVRASASGIASAKAFGEYFVNPITVSIAFLAEALGTGILSFVIFALTNQKNETMKTGFVPPIIGLTVGALIAVIAPLTQAGFNPARDFGPRIVAFLAGWKDVAFKGFWVYILAPILGAVLGAALADKVLYADD